MALTEPFAETWLDTDEGHILHLTQYGNPDGVPVLYLHGGPGAGCSANEGQLFDLSKTRLILLDQRGSGDSLPHGGLQDNNLLALLTDIERIRQWLKIEAWCLAGGSFGATLGLIYSGLCPKRVLAQVYWGLFIPSDQGRDWLYGGNGAAKRFPIDYLGFVGTAKADNLSFNTLMARYYRALNGGNRMQQCIAAWNRWERVLAQPWGVPLPVEPMKREEATARIESHYAINRYFDAYTLMKAGRGKWPAHTEIIQGSQDWVCPDHLLREFLAPVAKDSFSYTHVSGGFHSIDDVKMHTAVYSGCARMIASAAAQLQLGEPR
ncbi:alpha/beta fold hydrolase [Shewanella avicenniae]|uniref:Proline iminopeptidase n=1 Tax=Shewanella avicenniae TaxID=2814294 RepID=A0ABX7QR21_9GAMM|nr:alpha/beta fold hydrolase [Shewanella avicenniae]QSX33912.1 alpha/beta fold hydrolase [Shewanella avicenniae]